MADQQYIEHEGTVREVRDGRVKVSFVTRSACAHCQLKGVCSAADMADKEVEVAMPAWPVQPGEQVRILLTRSLGMRALAYGYLIPFVVVMTTFFLVYRFTVNEVASGLAALLVLVPYYLLLYLLRDKIHRQFRFVITQKAN